MSSLRLLNETSGSSVATVQVTNVFSEDFDVYKITMEHDGSTNGNSNLRYLGQDGSVYAADEYTFASLYGYVHTTHSESKLEGTNTIQDAFGNWEEGGSVTWIFNPYSKDSQTHNITQSIGYAGTTTPATPMRCIGMAREKNRFTGFQCAISTGTYGTITIRTYGLRVD